MSEQGPTTTEESTMQQPNQNAGTPIPLCTCGPGDECSQCPETHTNVALSDISAEREHQREKWGDDHDDEHGSQDDRHLIDLAQDRLDLAMDRRYANSPPFPAGSDRAPLIQAAALIVAEIERMDRRTPTEGAGA